MEGRDRLSDDPISFPRPWKLTVSPDTGISRRNEHWRAPATVRNYWYLRLQALWSVAPFEVQNPFGGVGRRVYT